MLIFSPSFIIVIDWVSRTAYSSSTGKQWTLASRFEYLHIANDTCSLKIPHRLQDSQL